MIADRLLYPLRVYRILHDVTTPGRHEVYDAVDHVCSDVTGGTESGYSHRRCYESGGE